MIIKKIPCLLFVSILIITGCGSTGKEKSVTPDQDVRNIILFIGDGMGVAQLYAGMTASSLPFSITRFPFSGFSITCSADKYITDSAAGGTAIACGIKTNNGMIGISPDTVPVKSIIEIAHNAGLSTGVVSTSFITHATPASFVAHNINRNNYEEIASDYLNGHIDLFIGGGEDHFRKRSDGRDLSVDLKNQGFDVVYSLDELKASESRKIAGLMAKLHMPKVMEGRQGMLEEMTKKAIETLNKDPDGFFLVVEGSMIDWGGHENNLDYIISETIDLDKAVGVALDFAKKNTETLIIVTADHETSGLVLTGGDVKEHKVTAKFAVKDHTAVMVPVFSYGPGSEKFSGIHDNTFFLHEFVTLLKIDK